MHILDGYTVQISIECYFQTQSPSDKDLHETVRKVVHLHSLYLIISQAKQLKAYKAEKIIFMKGIHYSVKTKINSYFRNFLFFLVGFGK